MSILLISADEGDFQPLGIAGPAAYLRAAGVAVQTVDLTRESGKQVDPAEMIAFSIAIFGSIEPALAKAREFRASGYTGTMVFYNQYAIVQPANPSLKPPMSIPREECVRAKTSNASAFCLRIEAGCLIFPPTPAGMGGLWAMLRPCADARIHALIVPCLPLMSVPSSRFRKR